MLATSSAGSMRVSTGSSACSLNHFCTSPDSMLTSPDSSTVMRTSTTLSLAVSSPSGNEAVTPQRFVLACSTSCRQAHCDFCSASVIEGTSLRTTAGHNSMIVCYSTLVMHTFRCANPLQQNKKYLSKATSLPAMP